MVYDEKVGQREDDKYVELLETTSSDHQGIQNQGTTRAQETEKGIALSGSKTKDNMEGSKHVSTDSCRDASKGKPDQ
jgi:hypothetical protein